MAVLLETSKGDLVIDLFTDECPLATRNFLKLCKIKYYNNVLFHNVQTNFIAQTGDPTGTGKGGNSIYGVMYGEQATFFEDEIHPHLRHRKKGTVSMAGAGENMNASQFFITLAADLDSLDDKHTVFGEVSEGLEVLDALNEVLCDAAGRPLQNVRVRHTILLDDPFPDPPQLAEHIPDTSPPPVFAAGDRLEDDWVPEDDARPIDEIEKETREREAENRAVVLEMIGDLPEADAKPPSNMLFICKLNPVTTEEDLEIIFSRFGTITSCDIIRDWKTGDSLNYAFLGFDNDASCEEAFFKMNNCLIDDRRIKVDFSQSVHHLWKQYRRHGKAGGAEEAAAADAAGGGGKPERGGAAGHASSRLELKPGAGGVYAGPSGVGQGRGSYGLVMKELDGDRRGGPPDGQRGRGRHENGHGSRRDKGRAGHDRGGHPSSRDEARDGGPDRSREQRSRHADDRDEHRDGHRESSHREKRERDGGGDRDREGERQGERGRHRSSSEQGDAKRRKEDRKKEKKHKHKDKDRDRGDDRGGKHSHRHD